MSLPESLDLTRRREVAEAAVRSASREASILLPHTRSSRIGTIASPATTGSAISIAAAIESAFPGESILVGAAAGARSTAWLVGGHESAGAHAFPAFGPELAYLVDGEPVVAAVQVPTFDETFSAAAGHGATLDGRRIEVAAPRDVERTLVLSTHLEIAVPSIGEVVARLAGWRMPSRQAGPLALLCYLATGRIDGFVTQLSGEAAPAAGELLVREAGGVTTTIDGGGTSARNSVLAAASNAALLEQMLRRLEIQGA